MLAKEIKNKIKLGDIVNNKWKVIKKGQTRCICRLKKIERSFYYEKNISSVITTIDRKGTRIYDRSSTIRGYYKGNSTKRKAVRIYDLIEKQVKKREWV